MSGSQGQREKLREKIAEVHGILLYKRYSEKAAAVAIGLDYSTLKRKRRAGLLPFVNMGSGSVGYMGYQIADIIAFGVNAKGRRLLEVNEAVPWASTHDASSNAETGGSAPSLEDPDTSAAGSKAGRSSASALALAILTKRKSV